MGRILDPRRLPLLVRLLVPATLLIGGMVLAGAMQFARVESGRVAAEVTRSVAAQRDATLGLLKVIDALVGAQAEGSMNVLLARAARLGPPRLGPPVQVGERTVADLLVGGTPMANRFELVDEVTRQLGGTATVFVRDGDDFVRISTNVMREGQRAIGTVLDPKGAAIAAVRAGETFRGLVDILGSPYITVYVPMRAADGEIIGIWYVGYPLDMQVLARHVTDSRVLTSGFQAVLDRAGKVRFHSGHVRPEAVPALLADAGQWAHDESAFEAWGFRVATAYPRSEVEMIARERFVTVMTAGVVGALLLLALLAVLVKLLVLRPLGGEPGYAKEVARRIAEGRLDEGVRVKKGDSRSLLAAMDAAQRSVQAMADDARLLVGAALEGRLSARADATRHHGEYRRIVEGVNATLDAVVGPLNVAATCVDRIGCGDIPAPITEDYRGDFGKLKENLNACIAAIEALVADANSLAGAAVAGELGTRAQPDRHRGDYRRIVEGVNATLDAVTGPIEEVKRVTVALAGGDLRQRVDGAYRGDFAVLQQAVNGSIDRLNELVGGIKDSADSINGAAREIAAGNSNLSHRTDAQATSLEQASARMEELASTVKQNAANARDADELARGASVVAARGGESVRDVVATMSAIAESSRTIADIVAVIDSIAFQTNILALNAAVEAARAGEHGRGFAVVSGEVRTLAQRSADAAREIRALIGRSVETVAGGSRLVEQAGATMDEIVAAVDRVTAVIAAISTASGEQARGLEQVAAAVTEMDEATRQNSTLVEESAAAAAALEVQADALAAAVAAFRMDSAVPPERSAAA